MFDYRAAANKVLTTEINALKKLEHSFNQNFIDVCNLILANKVGKVVVMGMGKSGHIGKKIAATFASTGTPAFFVHPGEAAHGDLGMVSPEDIVITISNSGESSEILGLFPVLKRLKVQMISITGKAQSTMAKLSDYHLLIDAPEEACPLGLAPTSSTTATLVMGDALAVALLQARGFTAEDFALSHPGGALGRKLLLRLTDIMHTGDSLPLVPANTLIKDALIEISQKGLGMVAVVGESESLVGIFTDGDLRRILDKRIDIHSTAIGEVMTVKPTTANANMLAAEALNLMQENSISGLIICEDKKVIGALNMHDFLKAGVL